MRHSSVVQSFGHSTTFSQKRQVQHLALLAYRVTPLECGKSPAELFFGRLLRTIMPNVQHHENANLKERERKTKRYYDQSANPLKPLPTNKHLSDYITTDNGNRQQ